MVSMTVAAANPAQRLHEQRGFAVVSDASDSITMRLDL
jgi:hypothetical protein